MKWTKDKPTEEGWYWYKERILINQIRIGIGLLRLSHGGSLAFYAHDFVIGENKSWDEITLPDIKWAGPVPEPEDD